MRGFSWIVIWKSRVRLQARGEGASQHMFARQSSDGSKDSAIAPVRVDGAGSSIPRLGNHEAHGGSVVALEAAVGDAGVDGPLLGILGRRRWGRVISQFEDAAVGVVLLHGGEVGLALEQVGALPARVLGPHGLAVDALRRHALRGRAVSSVRGEDRRASRPKDDAREKREARMPVESRTTRRVRGSLCPCL